MGKKRVLSVGYYLAGGQAEYVDLLSDQSLLDADIVLFEPDFGEVKYSDQRFITLASKMIRRSGASSIQNAGMLEVARDTGRPMKQRPHPTLNPRPQGFLAVG